MADEKEIISKSAGFVTLKYFAYFFTLLTGLVVARFLGPAAFGIFSALMIVEHYSNYIHLGILHAMMKLVPFYKGKGNKRKADNLKRVAFASSFLMSCGISLLIFISSFLIRGITAETRLGLRIVCAIIIVHEVLTFFQSRFTTEKKFHMFGWTMVVYSATYFVLVLVFISHGLVGVLSSALIAQIAALLFVLIRREWTTKPKIDLGYGRELIKTGFPLLVVSLFTILFTSIDQIMIGTFLGKTQLGYYSLAVTTAGAILFIPSLVSSVIFPYILERYGKRENKKDIQAHLFQSTWAMSQIMPIVGAMVFVVVPFLVFYLFPDYLPGMFPIKLLIFATFFMAILANASNFLITINKEKTLFRVIVSTAVLAAILNYLVISAGYGIKGVAVATLATYVIYSLAIMLASFRNYLGFKDILKFILKTYAAFVYMLVIILISELFVFSGVFFDDIILAIIKMAVFAVLSAPILWYLNKKTRLVTMLFSEGQRMVFRRKN